MKINDKYISILAFLLCMLFASSEAYTQNGFVFAGGDWQWFFHLFNWANVL